MRCRCRVALILLGTACFSAPPARAQHHELGKVSFPTSCNAAVQAEFETGVAMLHSYWFNYAGKTVPRRAGEGSCVRDGLLGHRPRPAGQHAVVAASGAEPRATAWELLEKARGVEVKTERERLWLDAIRAYFRNHDTVPVEQRLAALQRRDAAARGALSAGFRGAGLLRADAAGLGAEERHDLRQSAQVGGDARKAVHRSSRSIPASRIT